MSNRFGRNQKRKMRNEIDELKKALAREQASHRWTQHEVLTAKQRALETFVKNTDLMTYVFREMAYGLGKALAPELQKYKDELLALVIKEPLEFEYMGVDFARNYTEMYEMRIPLKPLHIRRLLDFPTPHRKEQS